jgi:hypothetical protein
MATTPVLNQFGGAMGTNNMAPGAPIAGMGNSTSNYIPMPPQGGSQNNPTGTSGGSTSGTGVPMVSTPGSPGYGAGSAATTPNPVAGQAGGQLSDIYGVGVGGYLSNLLQNNGMNLPLVAQTNAAEINGMQQQINSGSANLAGVLGAQGVSGNSSTNALAQSNYQAQAAAAENSTISQNYMQEYNQGQQLLQSILGSVLGTSAQNEADKFNWEDIASLGLGLANTGANVVKAIDPFGI